MFAARSLSLARANTTNACVTMHGMSVALLTSATRPNAARPSSPTNRIGSTSAVISPTTDSAPNSVSPSQNGSPAQAEAQSTLRSLQDQGSPYRQTLADMAKLNVNDPGAVVSGDRSTTARPSSRTS